MKEEYNKEIFTVYSEKHNVLGYFVKIGKGDDEIIVETLDKNFVYNGFDDYIKDDWEFTGLI